MKKVLALAFSFMLSIGSYSIAAEQRGSIERKTNYVQVKHSSGWEAADTGTSLFVGSSLRTGPRSVAEIKYDDGSMTRVGSRSNLVINDRKINIKRGYIWGKVDKNKTKGLKIFTATAIASITGTEFFVEVNSDKSTTITVLEGSIEVEGKAGKVKVTEGTYATVDVDGNASNPAAFDVAKVIERYAEVAKM
jgi:ferric-dicitrate binding protein FerR (iron transport regulator)